MSAVDDFLLERVVHHVLKADGRASVEALFGGGARADRGAAFLIAEVLWPTMECVETLRSDGLISRRTYNGAVRTLRGLLEQLERRLPKAGPHGRSILVLAAAGEEGDLGPDILATLAEAHGWMVFFAGAGLTQEEIVCSVERLAPDVLLVQGACSDASRQLPGLERALGRAGLRPGVQIAAAGGLGGGSVVPEGADLAAAGPLEILELLMLWPEHRSTAGARGFGALVSEAGSLDFGTMQRMVVEHLRGNHHLN